VLCSCFFVCFYRYKSNIIQKISCYRIFFVGRLGGIEPARLTDAKPGTEGPPGTGVEGLAAAYRDRFPRHARLVRASVRWQGAGLEQTGAAGGPVVREVERVCGRLRRPQSRRRVAVRAEVPWAAKVPRGLEPSWRDQLGTRA